jgi:hypothetical protein
LRKRCGSRKRLKGCYGDISCPSTSFNYGNVPLRSTYATVSMLARIRGSRWSHSRRGRGCSPFNYNIRQCISQIKAQSSWRPEARQTSPANASHCSTSIRIVHAPWRSEVQRVQGKASGGWAPLQSQEIVLEKIRRCTCLSRRHDFLVSGGGILLL